jgi:hypothetical protein
MAYFFRDDAYRHRPQQRNHGRQTRPVQLDPIAIAPPRTRDDIVHAEVQNMQDTIGTEDFLMKKLTHSEHPSHLGKKSQPNTARVQNNVFAEGKVATPPQPRLRPDPSDTILQKLWVEDKSKDENAAKMANNPTLVEKMMACQYPMPHPPSPVTARKKAAQLPREPNQSHEPEGFKGLGNFCDVEKPRGPRGRPAEYELPVLKLKPRTTGRTRGNIPADQWSFDQPQQSPRQ